MNLTQAVSMYESKCKRDNPNLTQAVSMYDQRFFLSTIYGMSQSIHVCGNWYIYPLSSSGIVSMTYQWRKLTKQRADIVYLLKLL